jgi:hypothetical protein
MWFQPKSGHTSPRKNVFYCSFCGKDQDDVQKLIAGPTVFICNECVDVCVDIIAQDTAEQARAPLRQLATTCTFCGKTMVQTLRIGDRGALCGGCADAIEDALSRGRLEERDD